jgi:hypothetical protein
MGQAGRRAHPRRPVSRMPTPARQQAAQRAVSQHSHAAWPLPRSRRRCSRPWAAWASLPPSGSRLGQRRCIPPLPRRRLPPVRPPVHCPAALPSISRPRGPDDQRLSHRRPMLPANPSLPVLLPAWDRWCFAACARWAIFNFRRPASLPFCAAACCFISACSPRPQKHLAAPSPPATTQVLGAIALLTTSKFLSTCNRARLCCGIWLLLIPSVRAARNFCLVAGLRRGGRSMLASLRHSKSSKKLGIHRAAYIQEVTLLVISLPQPFF